VDSLAPRRDPVSDAAMLIGVISDTYGPLRPEALAVASRLFRTLAHAVAAPKASFSAARGGTMFMYLRVDH
jgi:hypothetical protein